MQSLEKLQSDYKLNVVDKLDSIKRILSALMPLNYKLELLENIYSLIYVSSYDLKELNEDDDEEEDEMEDLRGGGATEATTNELDKSNEILYDTDMAAYDNDGYDIINEYNPASSLRVTGSINGNDAGKGLKKPNSPDEVGNNNEPSIYELENAMNLKPSRETENQSSKSNFGSYCSYASNSGSSVRYRQNGTYDEDDTGGKNKRRNKLIVYRRNAGGGGSFLVNDFLCRDLLFMLNDLLDVYTNKPQQQQAAIATVFESNSLACSIVSQAEMAARSAKLQQLVSETLWRFQLIRSSQVQMQYGQVTILCVENDQVAAMSEYEQHVTYELIKTKRKRANSSSSLHSSLNESYKHVRKSFNCFFRLKKISVIEKKNLIKS